MRYAITFFLSCLSLVSNGKTRARLLQAVPVFLITFLPACDDKQDVPFNFVAGFAQSTLTAPETLSTLEIEILFVPASSYDGAIKVWVQSSGTTYDDDFTTDPAVSSNTYGTWCSIPIKKLFVCSLSMYSPSALAMEASFEIPLPLE